MALKPDARFRSHNVGRKLNDALQTLANGVGRGYPRLSVSSMYEELVFGSNPLGWETLGTRETVSAATRETFTDYLGHWYTPPRIVVGVVQQ